MKRKSLLTTTILLPITYSAMSQQFIPSQSRPTTENIRIYKNEKGECDRDRTIDPLQVRIIGLGGANDLTAAQKIGGNLALGAYITIAGQHSIYTLFNARAGNTSDTTVIARTFLFPDIGKRDFTFGYEWLINLSKDQNGLQFIPFTELSWNRNIHTIDQNLSSKFYSFNFMFGAKLNVTKEFEIGDKDAEGNKKDFNFSIYPYYQIITTEKKDLSIRNEMLKESNLPQTFHTLGLYASLQVAEIGLFANYKRILNNTNEISNRDLSGGILVMGALISTNIFKF